MIEIDDRLVPKEKTGSTACRQSGLEQIVRALSETCQQHSLSEVKIGNWIQNQCYVVKLRLRTPFLALRADLICTSVRETNRSKFQCDTRVFMQIQNAG